MKKMLFAAVLAMTAFSATAWIEKWPVEIKITQDNFVSSFLRANFGKVGEIAARQLDSILSDPQKQAKLAKATIERLDQIYNKYQRAHQQ
jgi:hypothetical protein